ncbi:MAG TPA: hypothetical protein PLH92_08415 [Mycobacterium sp.]|uniref:hypothetical protein n=1 Tax=Mycolicibacterium sp. TaxID=2320850 RepID=UPI0026008A30|nr:hypothetical protein [Mycolicibacterium sp.]HPX36756.1 hypothetical protein [Mycobacterium sp.]HQC76730.1 hypothetical protein [Mycobacterium sp.]
MTCRSSITLAMAVLAAVSLSSCAADKGTTAKESPAGTAAAAPCTKEALAKPALDAAHALGPDNVYAIDHLDCADGWAVTGGLLADKSNPKMGAPTSFVFEQHGQDWAVQDKAKVCGTDPITTTAPADAKIPAALFLPGCAAG